MDYQSAKKLHPRGLGFSVVGFNLLCLLLGGIFVPPLALAQNLAPPYLVAGEGKVDLLVSNASRWVPAVPQVLRPGDSLRTGPDGRATIAWSTRGTVNLVAKLGGNTEVKIRPVQQSKHGLFLMQGIASFFHREKPGLIEVVTGGSIAGVKGTEFVMRVEPQGDTERAVLYIIDGQVEFANALGSLLVTNLQHAVAEPERAPELLPPGFIVNNVLQWAFYYPAVLDLHDLDLTPDEEQLLAESLTAYQSGDLLAALDAYPQIRQPQSPDETLYYAALLLSVGQVAKTEMLLEGLVLPQGPIIRIERMANALRTLIAAVKLQPAPLQLGLSQPTELLAASYYEQSLATGDDSLRRALTLARLAATNSPDFSFAWARVAELEFSFGQTRRALRAVERSLTLSPRNAQALVLKGFLLTADNRIREAMLWFNHAIAVDPGLGVFARVTFRMGARIYLLLPLWNLNEPC
jgi:tetratricopeptide (TPR) repeat protein